VNIYTRAIHFKNGDILTITEDELKAVQKAILGGNRWVRVQGELISADTIARIGNHHATAEIAVREEANNERNLILRGHSDLVDKRRKSLADATFNRHSNHRAKLPVKEAKEAAGEPQDVLSWTDTNGEIHYS
jgi:hypothetical protein